MGVVAGEGVGGGCAAEAGGGEGVGAGAAEDFLVGADLSADLAGGAGGGVDDSAPLATGPTSKPTVSTRAVVSGCFMGAEARKVGGKDAPGNGVVGVDGGVAEAALRCATGASPERGDGQLPSV